MDAIPGYTTKAISPVGSVNKADLLSWLHGFLVFLIPLGIVYLLQLSGALQKGFLTLGDFSPTQMTQGAAELYILNRLLDLLRKFNNGKP